MPAARRKSPPRPAADPPAPDRNQRVWAAVRRIPRGRVTTYGQIARDAAIAGPTGPRQVGYALAALAAGTRIPWHRVVNAAGRISPRDSAELQRELLEAEGVVFSLEGAIDLAHYGWRR